MEVQILPPPPKLTMEHKEKEIRKKIYGDLAVCVANLHSIIVEKIIFEDDVARAMIAIDLISKCCEEIRDFKKITN